MNISSYFFCRAFATFNSEFLLVGKPFSIFAMVCGARPAILASFAVLNGMASRNCLILFFLIPLLTLYKYQGAGQVDLYSNLMSDEVYSTFLNVWSSNTALPLLPVVSHFTNPTFGA